jgi:uncharacterized protein YqeY
MTVMDILKAAVDVARKNKNEFDKTKLSTLLGSIENERRRMVPPESFTDGQALAVIGKFVKSCEEVRDLMLEQIKKSGFELERLDSLHPMRCAYDVAVKEIELYRKFLPAIMTEPELKALIESYVAEGLSNVGAIMKRLGAERPNEYHGKMASSLANQLTKK